MRRNVAAAILAGLVLAGMVCCFWCGVASAKEPIRFRQHLPAYVATNYSTSESWEEENTPYLKAQASMAVSVLRNPMTFGAVSLDPYLAFTWRAIDWPVGAESSPILENNYLPEAFIRVNEDTEGYFRGGRVGWLHTSSGTDSASASIDRVLLESKFAYDGTFSGRPMTVTGYARGWYTLSTGEETEGIKNFLNFGLWDDAGGELMAVVEIEEALRAVVTLGLSYQVYELYVPLADAYDIDLFGQLHHGYVDGIVDYSDRHTSGGVGLALVR